MTTKKKDTALATVKKSALPADTTPPALLQLAIDTKAPVEYIRDLMQLQKEWEKGQAEKAFNLAMAAFQKACPVIRKKNVVKSKTGSERYKFASIGDIVSQVKDLIAANDLYYDFTTEDSLEFLNVTCTVTHSAGHSKATSFKLPIGKEEYMTDVQKYGARLTFGKRYAFCNAFGITTAEEDTDAREPKDETGNPSLIDNMQQAVELCKTLPELQALWSSNKGHHKKQWFVDMVAKQRKTLEPDLSNDVAHAIAIAETPEQLDKIFNSNEDLQRNSKFIDAIKSMRTKLGGDNKPAPLA